jgi:DNA polymerase I
MNKRLVIIDGKSVFYRGYYAMPNLATKDGTPTGGVYGFAVMALEIVKKLKPNYVCVAWDKPKTNIRARLKLYPQYKAGRKPAPPDFYAQVPILHDLLNALGWPLYEADDYEADDIMAAFAKQAKAKDIETYLVTSDLDVLQLVDSHTHIYTLKKGLTNIELFNEESFKAKYGVGPHQWCDVKALKGDSSDNIPGVAGIGEKTALDLIKQYGTLDEVYENVELLKKSVRDKLVKDKDMAYLSQKLVTLITDIPLKLDLTKAKLQNGVTPEYVAMLRKLEFRSLLRQVESALPKGLSAEELSKAEENVRKHELPEIKEKKYDDKDFAAGKQRVVALSPDGDELWVSPIKGYFSRVKTSEADVKTLANGPLIGHDLKGMLRALLQQDIDWPGEVEHDTRIAAFVLNALIKTPTLSDIRGFSVDMADPHQLVPSIWEAYKDQHLQFDQSPKLYKVAKELDFPSIKLLAKVEDRGVHLDVKLLKEMSKKFAVRIKEFEQEIYKQAGEEFTISSPQQLSKILYEKLALPTQGVKKGKTGYSTGAAELDKLRLLHPIADLITQYREYTKLKSTYIDALPKLVDDNGKLHTTYELDVAATGRLSSNNPNLQNIPTRTEIGQAIRSAFVPAKGNVFVSADYSQFELRLSAVLSDDKKMVEEFNNDVDIHAATAAEIYNVPLDKVTKDQRRNAKTVNFGVLYGMSPHGLSIATGMTMQEARDFIQRYFDLRKPLRAFMDKVIHDALRDGFVATMFGRQRPTPDLKSSNFAVREAAKRAAINMPAQGTEADIMKLAMLAIEEKLAGLGEQILQIHDSILVECPAANAPKVEKILQETMENAYKLPVKLKVDVKTGGNWGEL